MQIIDKSIQIRQHISPRKQGIKYIVVHDTGNTAPYAGAITHMKYFSTTSRKASADFVVDDSNTIQLNDYRKYFTWHCGDGKGKNGITNSNSIGIEICVDRGGNLALAHAKALYLIVHLMRELNLPLERVVRHYDASGKICPAHMSANSWEAWRDFKDNLQHAFNNPHFPHVAEPKRLEVVYEGMLMKNIDYIIKNDRIYLQARSFFEALGHTVRYEDNTVYIHS